MAAKHYIAGTGAAAVIAASVAFITPFEGISLTPYYDIAGIKTWCAGETEGTPKPRYTTEECMTMISVRVSKDYYGKLAKCINSWENLPPEVRIAFTSFAYNLGVGKVCGKPVETLLERGALREACNIIPPYDKARIKGVLKSVRGLTTRRIKERDMCMKGVA